MWYLSLSNLSPYQDVGTAAVEETKRCFVRAGPLGGLQFHSYCSLKQEKKKFSLFCSLAQQRRKGKSKLLNGFFFFFSLDIYHGLALQSYCILEMLPYCYDAYLISVNCIELQPSSTENYFSNY